MSKKGNNWTEPVCKGCWSLGNNCGSCQRCRAEAKAAIAEVAALRQLLLDTVYGLHEVKQTLAAKILQNRIEEIKKKHEVER